MFARFVHDSDRIDYTPEQDVRSGDIVQVGDFIGIARLDIPAGTLGCLWRDGVYDLVKGDGVSLAFPFGAPVYWNPETKKVAAAESAGFIRIGVSAAQADEASAEILRFALNA